VDIRSYPLPQRVLAHQVPLLIIESPPGGIGVHGPGSARVLGSVVFKSCAAYASKAEWERDQSRHRFREAATSDVLDAHLRSALDWHDDIKYRWEVAEVTRFPSPRPIFSDALRREFRSLFSVGAASEIYVVSTHLDSDKSPAGTLTRRYQMEALLSELCRFAGIRCGEVPPPVVFTGDFNAPRHEACVNEVLSRHFLNFSSSLTDCGIDANPEVFSSYKIRTGSYKPGLVRYLIDHIYVSERLRCHGALDLATRSQLAAARNTEERQRAEQQSIETRRALKSAELTGKDKDLVEAIAACDSLPALAWPSDHLSLYAELSIK